MATVWYDWGNVLKDASTDGTDAPRTGDLYNSVIQANNRLKLHPSRSKPKAAITD